MSGHKWRQGHGIDPLREWMRRDLPASSKGLVIIDMDVALRRYGRRYGLDALGDLMLIEKKEYIGRVTRGERHIYNWLNNAMLTSEYRERWRGIHLLEIVYSSPLENCPSCGQPIQSADQAYQRFVDASLVFDGGVINHDELRETLEARLHENKDDPSISR